MDKYRFYQELVARLAENKKIKSIIQLLEDAGSGGGVRHDFG